MNGLQEVWKLIALPRYALNDIYVLEIDVTHFELDSSKPTPHTPVTSLMIFHNGAMCAPVQCGGQVVCRVHGLLSYQLAEQSQDANFTKLIVPYKGYLGHALAPLQRIECHGIDPNQTMAVIWLRARRVPV